MLGARGRMRDTGYRMPEIVNRKSQVPGLSSIARRAKEEPVAP